MTHIAFITLFLGLTMGAQRVDLKVSGPAPRVEMQLDGRTVAILVREPWTTNIDFGRRLLPHQLVARVVDESGNELARADQTVNLPRSASEVQLVIERDNGGKPSGVQVLWQSIEADQPKSIAVSLDAKPLALDKQLHGELRDIDATRPHLLRARGVSPAGLVAETDMAFGGGLEKETASRLTPIAVRVRGTPNIETSLRVGEVQAHVVAVEELPADVIIVRHPIALETAIHLDPLGLSSRRGIPSAKVVGAVVPSVLATHTKPIARFVWPVSMRANTTTPSDLFAWSHSFQFTNADEFKSLLTEVGYAQARDLRYADAVAIAGLQAISARRPRAVILLLGDAVRDVSELRPRQSREYLRAIGVPLYVWSLGSPEIDRDWGEATDVSTPQSFRRAFEAVQSDLQSQRIVWIEGDHLPPDITAVADGLETLARR